MIFKSKHEFCPFSCSNKISLSAVVVIGNNRCPGCNLGENDFDYKGIYLVEDINMIIIFVNKHIFISLINIST